MNLPDNRLLGIYQGTVTSVEDEDKMDRIAAFIPALFSGTVIGTIRPVTVAPGWSWKPSVDDFVWIMFENGDPERPLYLGSWWPQDKTSKEATLPDEAKTNYPNTRVLTTPAGHKVEFDDTEDATKIKATSAGGSIIELDDTVGDEKIRLISQGGHKIEITDKTGAKAITITHSGGAKVEIDPTGKVSVMALGDIELSGGGLPALGGVVTTLHPCAFTGIAHPAGSINVKASL